MILIYYITIDSKQQIAEFETNEEVNRFLGENIGIIIEKIEIK